MKNESKIQQEIIVHFRNNNLNTNNLIFSVPNESANGREAMYKKSIGLMAGVSDLICINNGKVFFVEVKDDKGKQSEKQKIFQEKVESQGFRYILVRSLEDFTKCINE